MFAICTLLMLGKSYLPGIITLAESIKMIRLDVDLLCMITPDIDEETKKSLSIHYKLFEVPYISVNSNEMNDYHLNYIYCHTFTKINMFNLNCNYKKILYLDADMLCLNKKIMNIFNYDTPAAIPVEMVMKTSKKYLNTNNLKIGGLINPKDTKYIESTILLFEPSRELFDEMKNLLEEQIKNKKITYSSDTKLISEVLLSRGVHYIDGNFICRYTYIEPIILDIFGDFPKLWMIDQNLETEEYLYFNHYIYMNLFIHLYDKGIFKKYNMDHFDKMYLFYQKFLNKSFMRKYQTDNTKTYNVIIKEYKLKKTIYYKDVREFVKKLINQF